MPLAQGKSPKSEEAIAACSAAIVERLREGKRVVVHCSGGLGRSGLVAACCLIGAGLAPNAAMEAVRKARPGAIERSQEPFLRSFRARALQRNAGQCRPEVFPVDPDVEAVLRSMLDELDVSTSSDETLRGQIFERYLVGDEFPSTPLEAIHVLAVLRSSYLKGGDALARLGEVRLRRLLGSSLAVRSRISAKNTDGMDHWELAYGSRAAELVEPITQFLLKRRRLRLPKDEDAILSAAALRFDGYAYADTTGFDWQGWTPERYAAQGDQLKPLEVLALFFSMQRFLCKWGGEMLPRTHGRWWMYRELFFRVVEIPVPSAYREHSWWVDWKLEYAPRLDECIEVVARAHRTTAYDKEL